MRLLLISVTVGFVFSLFFFSQANAQDVWFPTGGTTKYLRPVNTTWGLLVPGVASTTTGCLSIASNGWISPSGSACSSGSSSLHVDAGDYVYPHQGNYHSAPRYVATSTTATSTFAGGLAVETSGLVYNFSTNNVGIGTAAPNVALSIYRSGTDLPALRLEDGDITIPFTGILNPVLTANTVGSWSASASASGGMSFNGFTNNTANAFPIFFNGFHGSASPTNAPVIFSGRKTDGGTGATALASTEKLISIFNNSITGTEVLTILGSGNLGIASTSPYAKLSVTNTGTGPSFVVEDSTSPDSTPFAIDASGNVGIGTASMTFPFEVHVTDSGTGWGANAATAATFVQEDQTVNNWSIFGFSTRTSTGLVRGVANISAQIEDHTNGSVDGELVFHTFLNNTPGERMRITNSGEVGIGTTTPDVALVVSKNTTSSSFGTYPALSINNDAATGYAGFNMTKGTGTSGLKARAYIDNNNDFFIGSFSLDPVNFTINNSTKVTIDTSGNVGIGTTTPNALLQINSASAGAFNYLNLSDSDVVHDMTTLVPNGVYASMGPVDSLAGGLFLTGFSDTGSAAFIFDGITGASPTQSAVQLRGWKKSGTTRGLLSGSEGVLQVWNGNASAGGSALLTVTAAGDLGIGTTTPGAKLAVAGSAIINDLLTTASFIATSSAQMPNGTAPVVDAKGEYAFDESDNQFLIGTSTTPAVIRTSERLFSFSIGSTSPVFASGSRKQISREKDGYTVTYIICDVEGGTSKVITLFGETLTCDADGANDSTISLPTMSAEAATSTTMGATTGTVDYVNISIFGVWTRE